MEGFNSEKVYEQAKQHVEDRIGFFWHLIIFIVVNAALVGIWYFLPGSDSYFWPKWSLFGWGIGLLIHFGSVFLVDGLFGRYRERKIEEFVKKERQRFDK